jgi:hypothetical protein
MPGAPIAAANRSADDLEDCAAVIGGRARFAYLPSWTRPAPLLLHKAAGDAGRHASSV